MGDWQMKNEKKEEFKKNKNGKINKKNINKNNGERGSITILVLASLLFFIMFFMTMYAKNTNKISAQEREIKEIEKAYNEDIKMEYSKKMAEIRNQSISNDVSYVGKYADIDDNGSIDGIIFADLAIGKTVPGNWGNQDGAYTIPKMTGLKEYYVKKTEKDNRWDKNNAKEVIAPKKGTSGKDRFYVMALEDVAGAATGNIQGHTWYKNAWDSINSKGKMDDWNTRTYPNFGKGKNNTAAMIKICNDKGIDNMSNPKVNYGESDTSDLWNLSAVRNTNKWFVPSKEEWSAFAGELKIDKNNQSTYNLAGWYWSSSQFNSKMVWSVYFAFGHMSTSLVDAHNHVRLATTF